MGRELERWLRRLLTLSPEAELTRVEARDMRAGRAGVSGTSATLSQARVTSGLSALSITGSTGRLSTLSETGLTGRLAGQLSALSLARLAGCRARDARSLTLRLTSIASYAACIARTRRAISATRIATRTEAGIPATHTRETGRVAAGSPTTFSQTRGPHLRPEALRRKCLLSTTTTKLDIKVKLVACFMSACNGAGCGEFCTLLHEDLTATETAERRLVRRKLLGMNYVVFQNLNTRTHIECEIEQPVTRFRTAVHQANEAGKTCWRLRTLTHQTLDDRVLLQGFLGIAALLIVCHIFNSCDTAVR